MVWNFLADEGGAGSGYFIYILLGVILVLLVVWMLFSGRKNKQRQKEYTEQLDAIGPGNKVKTAGGICGIVVEVCDDNTVIIETGSERSGKSYIKMDKELIAQTDAKGPTQLAREAAEEARRAEKEAKEAEKNAAPAEVAKKEAAKGDKSDKAKKADKADPSDKSDKADKSGKADKKDEKGGKAEPVKAEKKEEPAAPAKAEEKKEEPAKPAAPVVPVADEKKEGQKETKPEAK